MQNKGMNKDGGGAVGRIFLSLSVSVLLGTLFSCAPTTQGIRRTYYSDGTLRFVGKEVKGKIDSTAVWFGPNGRVLFVANYRDGVRQGMQTEYYENGLVKSRVNYRDGQRQGIQTEYNENGTVNSSVKYVDDKMDSVATWYWPNGKVQVVANYTPDGKVDNRLSYWPNGNAYESWSCANGKDGTLIRHYPNGVVQFKGGYVAGKANGVRTFYDKKGNPLEGTDSAEFPDKMKMVVSCRQGKPFGNVEVFMDQKLRLRASMKDGYPDGKWVYFDSSGRETSEEQYENGVFKTAR